MSGFDIQAKVKAGLAKATAATGQGDLVYKVVRTGKAASPLETGTVTRSNVELKNAIFKKIQSFNLLEPMVIAADIEMVSGPDVPVTIGDQIQRGQKLYTVDDVIESNPAGVVLSYISLLRSI